MIINFITLLKNKVIQCWNEIASAADSMSQRGLAARAVCAQMPHFLQQVLPERHYPSANAHTKPAALSPYKFRWIPMSRTAIEQAVPCVVAPMLLVAALPQFRAPANLRPKRLARAGPGNGFQPGRTLQASMIVSLAQPHAAHAGSQHCPCWGSARGVALATRASLPPWYRHHNHHRRLVHPVEPKHQ